MGCSGSKTEDLPMVVRCRERRDLIRAAANHRYTLAAAHISYFRSLRNVGDALRRFVDEELISVTSSSSSLSSPSLILPRDSKQKHANAGESSMHLRDDEDEDEESHLHLSDSSSKDVDFDDDHLHHHPPHHKHKLHEPEQDVHRRHKYQHRKGKNKGSSDEASHFHSEEENSPHYPRTGFNGYWDPEAESSSRYPRGSNFHGYGTGYADGYDYNPFSDPFHHPHSYHYPPSTSYAAPYTDQWGSQAQPPWFFSNNTNMFYMRKGAPSVQTVVQEPHPQPAQGYSDSYWNLGHGGNDGHATANMKNSDGGRDSLQKEVPPPPSPKASGWDFFNPFGGLENGYGDCYSGRSYGYGSSSSSPDSNEVRERDGIPDLEEETEGELYHTEVPEGKIMEDKGKNLEISSKSMPHGRGVGEDNFRKEPLHKGVVTPGLAPVHKSKSSSRSVPPPSSVESESEKISVPLQHRKDTAKPSMPLEYSDKSEKPFMPPPQFNIGIEKIPIPSQVRGKSVKPSISLPQDESTSSTTMERSISTLSGEKSSSPVKGASLEVEEVPEQDGDSPKPSSVTILSPRGTRDLREVVAEIRSEFEAAAGYGKEVAVMLEVGKVPYQPSFLKLIRSRVLYPLSLSLSSHDPPSMQSARLASKTMKLAKSYFDDVGKDVDMKASNLSSTLDKLYAWEKKLYKEVKGEEKLRVMYEKQCKRLRALDEEGAEPTKIEVARGSIRRLLTKLDVSLKAIDAISMRIHKLRDEELQPQVAELIHGFTRMWKVMLKCHRKQFRAMMEAKARRFRLNTAPHAGPDQASRASAGLERELRDWCARFNEWIHSQKSYVESLNGWLLGCLHYEPEETPDGLAPYSPARLGAPPIFVICNDWAQAMRAVSEPSVAHAMNTFAGTVGQLWEMPEHDKQLHEKKGLPVARAHRNSSGVSRLDDLKVDLDVVGEKVAEGRAKHTAATRRVHKAAASSLQGGMVPIFEALKRFTEEAVNAHEHVRFDRTRSGS